MSPTSRPPVESPEGARREEPSPIERAAYGPTCERIAPETPAELRQALIEYEKVQRVVVPGGRGTHAYLGNPPHRVPLVLSLSRLRSIRSYEPDDFTVSVEAGMPLRELRELLARNGQEIADDWPDRSEGTIGGRVACSLPGPRRGALGELRNQIIGIEGVRGGGRPWKAGGMVVKNVAGYEVAKFLCGALGTAGPLTVLNFKLRPLPDERRAGVLVLPTRDAAWRFAVRLRDSGIEPSALCVLNAAALPPLELPCGKVRPASTLVAWLLEGNRALVEHLGGRVDALLGEIETEREVHALEGEAVHSLLEALRICFDPGAEVDREGVLLRCHVLRSRCADLFAKLEDGLADSFERPPRFVADALTGTLLMSLDVAGQDAEPALRALAEHVEQHAGSARSIQVPAALRASAPWLLAGRGDASVERQLTRRVLRVFDPAGVFCPGRILG